MFNTQVSGYIGKQFIAGFVGTTNSENCCLVLSIEDGITQEAGNKIVENLKDQILHTEITNLASFENVVNSQIFKQNLPAHFSLAVGYLHDKELFIKTVGNGQVYFRRGRDFALLMSGDKSATGGIQEYDCAVFTTTAIQQVLGEVADIQLFVDMNAPKDIVEKLQNEEYDEEERGFAVVFAEFTTQAVPLAAQTNPGINPFAEPIVAKSPEVAPIESSPTVVESPLPEESTNTKRSFPTFALGRSKKIALILSIVLFGILLWSVVFGYQRRADAKFSAKVDETSQSVDTKLDRAAKEAFLDMDTSLGLIAQTKTELKDLQTESNGRNSSKIDSIAKHIQDAESKIVKKEEKETVEFYDLGLENKSAQGTDISREGDLIAILDSKNKTVYSLTLDKKSIAKYTSSEVSDASIVALYNENIYFFSQKKGIFQFITENKAKNVVKPDSEWGTIVDFEIFNGNFYIVDKSNSQIYKYVPTEGGYSEKSSYITSGDIDLSKAAGMSIDSSVYVAAGDTIQKFTRGAVETFKTEYPDKDIQLSGIYTDADIEQVYAWDREKSAIYILEKDGNYSRQLQTGILKNASSIFVYNNSVYALAGSKIYGITLD